VVGLLARHVFVRRPEIRNRIDVVDTAPVKQAGNIDCVLRGIDGDLSDSVGDHRDHMLILPSRAAKRTANGAPGPPDVAEFHSFSLQLLGESVHRHRFIAARP
jgi:hypothetical protein